VYIKPYLTITYLALPKSRDGQALAMTATTSLPIIDFSVWTSKGTPSERLSIAKELVKACHETGFVYIRNHGVPAQTLEEAFAWTKKFFQMPNEKKMEAEKPEGSVAFRGYCWPGQYKANQVLNGDEDEMQAVRAVPDYNVKYQILVAEYFNEY
jgi:isopenicillin N synthase-like dioxygenase